MREGVEQGIASGDDGVQGAVPPAGAPGQRPAQTIPPSLPPSIPPTAQACGRRSPQRRAVASLRLASTPPARPRLAIAFSGGVDSAVCVRLLQEQGFAVEAWHMLTCAPEPSPGTVRLAEALGVPLHIADLREAFEREVIAPFYAAYADGLTPNPCARCNPFLKFGHLRRAIGGPMATGHYVGLGTEPESGLPTLHRAADAAKDQSYFLCLLPPETLRDLRFPLADLTRADVVALARDWALPIPEARLASGSQDICFLPEGDYRPELRRRHPETDRPGDILDPEGRVIGRHLGLAHYTRGQRRGLGVATGGRAFVTGFDRIRNTLTLGPREALLTDRFRVDAPNWLIPPAFPLRCDAVSRYHHPPFPCTVLPDGTVLPDTSQSLITPGQVCAFYRGPWLLGGGLIAAD